MTQVIMQKIPSKPRSKYLNTASDLTFVSGGLIINNGGNSGTTSSIEIIDNLDSIDANKALSANMGRLLNERKWNATGGTINLMTLTGDLKIIGNLEVTEKSKLNSVDSENITSTYINSTQGNFDRLFADSITSSTITSDTVATDRITSKTYQSGNKGFSIDANGNAEFGNLNIRGEFNANSINYNKITSTNGEVWITDSAQIISIDDSIKEVVVTDNVFRVDDELLCQVFNGSNVKRCEIKITALVSSSTESATYQYTNISNSDKLSAGDTLIRTTNASNTDRNQYMKLSPYSGAIIDVIDNNNVAARLGCLSGISDSNFGLLSGYGLYSDNTFLKGNFATSSTQFNSDGSGFIANKAIQFDKNGNVTFSNNVKLNWQSDINNAVDNATNDINNKIDSTTDSINNKIDNTTGSINDRIDNLEESSNNKFENLELSATTVSSAVTECNNNYNILSDKVGNKLTYIDSTGIYTGTLAANQIVTGQINSSLINADEILSNGDAWALKKDGSGYLSNKKIEWDAEGNLTLQFGTRKEFKTIDIDDYDFENSFKVDLSNGLNFYFTKNKDNNPRTIILPCSESFIGLEVEMMFKGNPGLIRIECTNNYAFMYNGQDVRYISIGHYPRRLKLVARKYNFSSKGLCSWWIDNAAEFSMSSDGTFVGTFRSV
ncbi:hypothetical protein ACMSEZ_05275 [Bacteroides thetaiotaomicron]|uniref:hypothetical protein n=1 Tax=Bacteroides thetaiotaomicron TaxID=818 RepID=UPI0039C0A1C6